MPLKTCILFPDGHFEGKMGKLGGWHVFVLLRNGELRVYPIGHDTMKTAHGHPMLYDEDEFKNVILAGEISFEKSSDLRTRKFNNWSGTFRQSPEIFEIILKRFEHKWLHIENFIPLFDSREQQNTSTGTHPNTCTCASQ